MIPDKSLPVLRTAEGGQSTLVGIVSPLLLLGRIKTTDCTDYTDCADPDFIRVTRRARARRGTSVKSVKKFPAEGNEGKRN